MNKINQLIVLGFLIFCSACGKDNPSPEEKNSSKKVVEVKITFGSNYAEYGANFGLQVASVNGGLKDNFEFIGINSTASIVQEASVIHQANISPIVNTSQNIKTSVPVSTFSIATLATNLKENVAPLTANYDFYVDGKKTASKSLTFSPNSFVAKVLVLDATNPTQLIEN